MITAEERAAIRESFARLLTDQCSEEDVRRTMETDAGYDPALWQAMALVRAGGAAAGGEPWAAPHRIDPARARVAELMLLDGIGRSRAEAIVLHRVRNGPPRDAAELAAIDGIGAITAARLRPFLRFDAAAGPRGRQTRSTLPSAYSGASRSSIAR